jgi:hypothetical protein
LARLLRGFIFLAKAPSRKTPSTPSRIPESQRIFLASLAFLGEKLL